MDVLLSSDMFKYLFTVGSLFSFSFSFLFQTKACISLPSDIFRYSLSLEILRLRDIINLTMVSKNLREIALSEEYWYTISDTRKILYDFIFKVYESKLKVSYPYNKIRRMNEVNYWHQFNGLNNSALLRIFFYNQMDLNKFYNCFTDYQYYYVCDEYIDTFHKSLKGIHVYNILAKPYNFDCRACHTITEIIAPHTIIDAKSLTICYPQIKKLTVGSIVNVEYLKQTLLTYFYINNSVSMDTIFSNLPDTIESVIIPNGKSRLSDQFIRYQRMVYPESYIPVLEFSLSLSLFRFQHLNYLGIVIPDTKLFFPLKINTVHIEIPLFYDEITINIPNVRNIIVSYNSTTYQICKMYLTSENAVACKILGMRRNDILATLPNCPEIIILDYETLYWYDPKYNKFIKGRH
jgi:hypothetical protein